MRRPGTLLAAALGLAAAAGCAASSSSRLLTEVNGIFDVPIGTAEVQPAINVGPLLGQGAMMMPLSAEPVPPSGSPTVTFALEIPSGVPEGPQGAMAVISMRALDARLCTLAVGSSRVDGDVVAIPSTPRDPAAPCPKGEPSGPLLLALKAGPEDGVVSLYGWDLPPGLALRVGDDGTPVPTPSLNWISPAWVEFPVDELTGAPPWTVEIQPDSKSSWIRQSFGKLQ